MKFERLKFKPYHRISGFFGFVNNKQPLYIMNKVLDQCIIPIFIEKIDILPDQSRSSKFSQISSN